MILPSFSKDLVQDAPALGSVSAAAPFCRRRGTLGLECSLGGVGVGTQAVISGRLGVESAAANVKMKQNQTQRGLRTSDQICLSLTCKSLLHPLSLRAVQPSVSELCS